MSQSIDGLIQDANGAQFQGLWGHGCEGRNEAPGMDFMKKTFTYINPVVQST